MAAKGNSIALLTSAALWGLMHPGYEVGWMNFPHLEIFNVHPNLDTQTSSLFTSTRKVATATGMEHISAADRADPRPQ